MCVGAQNANQKRSINNRQEHSLCEKTQRWLKNWKQTGYNSKASCLTPALDPSVYLVSLFLLLLALIRVHSRLAFFVVDSVPMPVPG